jgi:hypothetical protein
MHASQSECADASLAQLCQACSYKTAIAFMRRHSIKEITCLDKKIYTLPNGKIRCLLKGMAQSLLSFFTFTRLLAKGSRAKMIIGSQYDSDNILGGLLFSCNNGCRWAGCNVFFYHTISGAETIRNPYVRSSTDEQASTTPPFVGFPASIKFLSKGVYHK